MKLLYIPKKMGIFASLLLVFAGGSQAASVQSASIATGVITDIKIENTAAATTTTTTTVRAPTTTTPTSTATIPCISATCSRLPPSIRPPITPPATGAGQTTSAGQTNVPVTFGQVFAQGDLLKSDSLVGKLSDGASIALQVDAKATHADGSVRHAVISAVLPKLQSQTQTIGLMKVAAASGHSAPATPADLLNAGFSASANILLDGQTYSVSANDLLKAGKYTAWLAGPIANEWLISAPLKTAQGIAHPHLTARFAIRSYTGLNKAKVDVTIENGWTYEPGPQNFTYDAQIIVGGQAVYTQPALTHFQHARWRKVFWWGTAPPQVHIKHNTAYLIASKAVPNYDTNLVISEAGLKDLDTRWASKDTGPMGPGIVLSYMPAVGGRVDIGPLTQWGAMYLLSMDSRAKKATLGTGDLAGSWPIHFRDKNTDRPVSIVDYPYIRTFAISSDSNNPVTKKSEAMPPCAAPGACSTAPYNYNPDGAHQPSMAYLPYLVTGDYFYLEELQFWANWNMLGANPYYRDYKKGLARWDQLRGQAWTLRTLGQTAYITPDSDPMKPYFVDRVLDNLVWYNAAFPVGNRNALGVYDRGMDLAAPDSGGAGIQPWMDDYFTWSIGYLAELGFSTAQPLLEWKAKFPVGRMTDPGYCWIDGAVYIMQVRPGPTLPIYSTLGEAYQATFQNGKIRNEDGGFLVHPTGAIYLDQPCGSQVQADWRTQAGGKIWPLGQMTGYAFSTHGYPSNMQPALAVAAASGIPNAKTAWNIFISRSTKPDYSMAPQFAIVPRK